VCEGQIVTIDATTANASYLWQDNSTGATFDASAAGTYWVEITVNNCSASDTIEIHYNPSPTVDLGEDTTLCEDDSLLLDATYANAAYLWQDSSTAATFAVSDSGTYWVQVSLNSCSVTDTIHMAIKACKVQLEMPNVFTPNADGTNDFFKPLDFKGILEATLIIYNRWGLKVFESADAATGWDGTFNGNYCAEGTYYWVLPYTDIFNNSDTLQGFLTLTQ
jgi:gliding motility-associated-like protein